ncbi:MAG TPA: outer membrane beta-barrel protein [Candidatus Polarisedimenticolia bacterium]|nr:outer membrane beta-barrel protein [Candidatus Polarisedimenticolia bacterium]
MRTLRGGSAAATLGTLLLLSQVFVAAAQDDSPRPEEAAPAAGDEAAAPRHPDRYRYLGGRVGYLRVEGVDAGSLNVGLMFGYAFNTVLNLEGSIDYHEPQYDLYNRSTYAFQASLYVYPLPSLTRFRPYGVGGVGYYYSDYDFDPAFPAVSDERAGDGGFHAGFGFDLLIPQNEPGQDFFFTVDLRYLFTQPEPDQVTVKADGLLATLGLKFRY